MRGRLLRRLHSTFPVSWCLMWHPLAVGGMALSSLVAAEGVSPLFWPRTTAQHTFFLWPGEARKLRNFQAILPPALCEPASGSNVGARYEHGPHTHSPTPQNTQPSSVDRGGNSCWSGRLISWGLPFGVCSCPLPFLRPHFSDLRPTKECEPAKGSSLGRVA